VSLAIRACTTADDPFLVSLAARSPMQAPLSICIERCPSFYALRDLRGPSTTLVAERAGTVVGCVSVTTRRVLWDGEPREVDGVADLKVAPAERRTGVARALVQAVLRRGAARLHVWTSAAGNDALAGVLRSSGIAPTSLATFTAFQLFPILVPSRPRHPVARARPSDEGELRALLDAAFRGRRLAPALADGPGLAGIPVDEHLVVRSAGRIVAALAIWEASSVKQTRLVQTTRAVRWLQRATMLLPSALKAFALPAEGSLLRFRYVRHAVCSSGAVDALSALFQVALRDTADRGEHFLNFACDDRDPLVRALGRIPRLTYRYELRGWHPDDAPSNDPRQALYFDDPALS
jgi:GNAT superfamily N-acetyltransferase